MEFESFEQGVIEIKLENNREETKNEAMLERWESAKDKIFCGKVFGKFAQLRCPGMVIH